MIAEVGPAEYVKGVRLSFESSLVVVRGLVQADEVLFLKQFVPKAGKKRVYVRPHLWGSLGDSVGTVTNTKSEVGGLVRSKLGPSATLYLQRPDMLRRGDTATHIDDRTVALSTSINLDGNGEPAVLRAARIAPADAPYREIDEAWSDSGRRSVNDLPDEVELNNGDAVIIGRGVVHSSVTGIERESLTIRTRGIFP